MGGVKQSLIDSGNSEHILDNLQRESSMAEGMKDLYYCFMCNSTKDKILDGAHPDPFDEKGFICTSCYNHQLVLRKEEHDDWNYYDEKLGSHREER